MLTSLQPHFSSCAWPCPAAMNRIMHCFPTPQPLLVNLSAMPNGIAWHNGSLWVASLEPYKSCRIYRLDNADRYALERQAAKLSDLVLVRGDLPFDIYHGWEFCRHDMGWLLLVG